MEWTKSKWSVGDLNGKKVHFRINLKRSALEGIGTFIIGEGKKGLNVQIGVNVPEEPPDKFVHRIYSLPQRWVDRIQRHPDQGVAEFRVM